MKKIDLVVNAEKMETKEYRTNFVKGSLVMKALQIGKKFEDAGEQLEIEVIYELADLIVAVYNNQFTTEELLDGINSTELFETLMNELQSIIYKEVENQETKDFLDKK